MSSFGSGHLSPSSPGSPNSYTNILEITNLNQSHNQHQPQGNIYQEYPSGQPAALKPMFKNLDIPPVEQAPSVNCQLKAATTSNANVYMNAEIGNPKNATESEKVVSKSTVTTPRQATLAKMESLEVDPDDTSTSSPDSVKVNATTATAVYMNVAIGGDSNENNLSTAITPPACSSSSASEAKENQPPIAITPPMLANNLNSKMNDIKKDYTKNVNGNIFGFTRALSFSQDPTRCYENLDVGNLADMKPLILRNARYSRPEIFSKVDLPLLDRTDKSEPCTPTQRKVNYIVLDLDQPNNNNNINYGNNNNNSLTSNNNGSADSCSDNVQSQMVNSASASSGLTLPESPKKKLGYATIDFDRSNALSNILLNNPINDFDQSCRKTRHDSNVTLLAMKHSNSMSD
jgi:hypothetical protein